jgi:hypothetical protein
MKFEKYLFLFLIISSYNKTFCQNMIINFNSANPNEFEIANIKSILVDETTFTVKTNSNGNEIYNINDINNCVFSNISSIEGEEDLKNISLFPNPFESELKIVSNYPIETIKMFDFYNKNIEITIAERTPLTLTIIPNPKLCKGLYILVINAGGKNVSKIIQNF